MARLKEFTYGGETLEAEYQETIVVEGTTGVICDVYTHPETKKRDLAVITIQPGCHTPLQRVLGGEETIEVYGSGKGVFLYIDKDGNEHRFPVSDDDEFIFSQSVDIGEIMQWQAAENSELQVFEICYPPFDEGRFENLPQPSS